MPFQNDYLGRFATFMRLPCLPIAIAALSFFCLLVPCAAQTSAAAPEAQASEVVLPIGVSNKHGEPVPGLTASDFTLTDNNKQQTIASFVQGSGPPLQIGILVDTSLGMMRSLDTERKAAESFVDLMLPAAPSGAKGGDQAFLLHFDSEVELIEDFTGSRSTLDSDLAQMGSTPGAQSSQGSVTPASGTGKQPKERGDGADLYDALYLAAHDMMMPRKGPKVLVVFSQGTDLGSRESINDAIDAAERAHTVVYTIYFKGNEEPLRLGRGGVGNTYPDAYPYPGGYPYPGYPGGYPGGIPTGGRTGVPPINGKKNLADIATRTGGRAFEAKKAGDLAGIYNQIAGELHGLYLLSYTPNPFDADGSFHKIGLTAKQSDLTVAVPEGYYAPGGDTQ